MNLVETLHLAEKDLQRVLNTRSPQMPMLIARADSITDEALTRFNRQPWSVIEYRGSIPPQVMARQLTRCAYCGGMAESFPCRGCGAPRV